MKVNNILQSYSNEKKSLYWHLNGMKTIQYYKMSKNMLNIYT